MKIFIDSASLDEIEDAYSCGLIDGVTTNPSLIKKAVDERTRQGEDIDIAGYIKKILRAAEGTPVSLEVTGITYQDMAREGKILYKLFNSVAKNVCIKIPINPSQENETGKEFDGVKAIRALSSEGIPVNCTLIFTPEQALMAAKAGARYVSPFAGRIDDYIRTLNDITFKKTDYYPEYGQEKNGFLLDDNGIVSGIDLCREIKIMFQIYDITTEVLAASIRNARQVREAALAGAHIATIPYGVIADLLNHYKTREGIKSFMKDTIPEYKHLMNGRR
jgi:transaldolase